MRRELEIAVVAMVSLMAIAPLVAPVTTTTLLPNQILASVTVDTFCDVAATGPIDFLTLYPGTTSSTETTTVSEPTGNIFVQPNIYGTTWSGANLNTMGVGATQWSNTNTTFTSLGLSPGVGTGDFIGPSVSDVVSLKVVVPAGQAADSYTQTITFEVTC
jgi:hypothetical protein